MIAVVAHTSRAEKAHQLMDTVGAAYMSVDNGTLGCERNHHRAWSWLNNHNRDDWAVVLEDDAIPVNGFTTQLAAALDNAPAPIVSLYLGRKRPPHWQNAIEKATTKATDTGACWITTRQLLHAVGVAVRTELVPDMLDATMRSVRPWDYRIGEYARHIDEHVAYMWPSLLDHADGPTVTKHEDRQNRIPGRKAWWTGTRDVWTPEQVTMP